MIRRLSTVLLLACGACAADRTPEGAGAASAFRPSGDSAPAAPGEAYLVWSAGEHSPGETAWIDGEGRVLARRAGVVAAGSGGLWAWTEGKESTRGVDCECLHRVVVEASDEAKCMTEAEVATVHLVDLLGGRRVSVLAAEPDSINAPPEQSAVPLSGVGPFLFVESDADLYACGAHGFHNVEARIYDLSRGAAAVELLDSAAVEAVVARHAVEARARMAEEFGDDIDFGALEEGMDLTKVEARWQPAGALELAYQLTVGTCYACSDGRSSSYTRSAVVPAGSVPDALAAWTRAPEAVQRYWQAAPPGERAGWSRVDAADPAAALARFRQP